MKLPLPIFITLCALGLTPAGADQVSGSDLVLGYAREHDPEFSAMRYEADAAAQCVQPTRMGCMVAFLSLIVIPALYALVKAREMKHSSFGNRIKND